MSKKKETNKKQEIIKTNAEVLPIRFYDENLNCFILEDDSCLDIFNIVPSDRSNLQGDELQYNIINNMRFYRLYSQDIKLISMNFPVNTSLQRELLKTKIKTTTDEVRKLWLEREINELELLDKNVTRREFYFMYFGNNRDDFVKNKSNILKGIGFGRNKLVEEIEKEKKIQIIKKLCNMNSLILPNEWDIYEVNNEEE